ncbi:MAG TPA: hypothetical protein VNA19_11105 [Pyrinomonadaceae bacterium]|nr:hypothetical protein [Pyrinomonadaceae bacterium]
MDKAGRMEIEQAQGVALRCVRRVGSTNAQLMSVLKKVGIRDDDAVDSLRATIVHDDIGVKQEGYKIKTAQLASLNPDMTVDDVADVIQRKAEPRAKRLKPKPKSKS